MKIKDQLLWAFSSLLVVILLLGCVGTYYIYRLSENSKAILTDNYRTLSYMYGFEKQLQELSYQLATTDLGIGAPAPQPRPIRALDSILVLQEANITERGERDLTRQLRENYQAMRTVFENSTFDRQQTWNLIQHMQDLSSVIYHLNQDAITERNRAVNQTAEEVLLYMILVGASALIFALIFTFTMPGLLVKPIFTFNEAIKKISIGDYEVKVPAQEKNEFGQLADSFNTMAEKLKEYEQSSYAKTLKEKKRLIAIINQIHDPIIGLDDRLKVLFANPAALSLLHKSEEDIIGRHASEIAESNNLMWDLIKELMTGLPFGEEKKYSPVRISENNTEKLFSKDVINVIITPTGEDRQLLAGHVIMLTDITEFAERDRAKTRFIATLSHELKTPVAAIDLAGSLLKADKGDVLSSEQMEYVTTIIENNARIRRTINEILDLAKIETGSIEVRMGEIGVGKFLETAIMGVAPFCREKGVEIQNLSSVDDHTILADPQKTAWILNNILINAIRYSPENEKILVKAVEEGASIKISVQDRGPGIKAEQIDHLFLPFSRIPDDKTDGSGLGLAISKEFVEAMGGGIGLERNYRNGAEFWIRLRRK